MVDLRSIKGFPVRHMTTPQRIVWLILSACLALLLYLAFRGYLAPALLLDFANSLLC